MSNMKKIGPAVRMLRKKSRMTLEQLAHDVGYDQGNLSKFERGIQDTDDGMIERLATALGTTVQELLRLTASLDDEDEPGNYPVASPVTSAYAEEPKPQYLEVKAVPIYEGVHLKALAEDQANPRIPPTTGTIPGPPDTRARDFAWLVTDDSMTAPPGAKQSFPIGTYTYFDPTLEAVSGDAVLVSVPGVAIAFTSLQVVNGTWMMVPLNHRYPTRDLPFNSKILAVALGTWAITRER